MTKRYVRNLVIILIVLAIAIYIDLPNSPGVHILGIERDFDTKLGLDLVGGVQALLEADMPAGSTVTTESMQTAVRIVENRVNALGVTEAVVQQAGEDRIVVELPGQTDPEKALSTIKQTGMLEFVDFSDVTIDQAVILEGQEIQTDYGQDTATAPSPTPTVPAASEVVTATEALTPTVTETSTPVFHTVMTGSMLKNVAVTRSELGEYQVAFELTSEGSKIFADYTSTHIGKMLAIVLDKRLISAPTINSAITEGNGVITGNFTLESANALAIQLRYGSLPIPLKIVETRTVGPTLGQDSLNRSLLAGAIGFSIVFLFMALYYRLPGLIADVAIIIYALVAYALFRYIPVTLTLPGVAGFLLSTGSALDANILIFERLKEELRAGRKLGQAIDLGWQRAWPSIRDSNVSTIITCAILFWFGSTFGATIVKGFSLTLVLGVGVSLFTAIVVTHTLLGLVLNYFQPKNLNRWFGI
ncbi:MAG: protein translocase subunit SecD [Anaerolineales bacterium]|nr:protein translocase subunit SecD [Anaerolineales bacterium]